MNGKYLIVLQQARMYSQVGEAPNPHWKKRIKFEVSGAFRIRWIRTGFIKFDQVTHIENAYLGYQAVTFGKDCQEIEGHAGHALCNYLEQNMKAWQPKLH
jgi:hypothetical protein